MTKNPSDNERKERTQTEQRLNDSLEMAGIGQWELDLRTGQLIWTPAVFRIFGVDRDEAVPSYDAFRETIHPEDRDAVNRAYTDALETGTDYEIDYRLPMPGGGRIKYVREACRHEADEHGALVRSVGIVRDITPLREVESRVVQGSEREAAFSSLAVSLVSAGSIEEISSLMLETGRQLLESPYGFIGYIDPETGWFHVPTMTDDICEACRVRDKSHIFTKVEGIRGWVQEKRKPVLSNDVPNDPRSAGIPEGHIPIQRFISAPALIDEEIVGQVAFANAGNEYTHEDLKTVERLASLLAQLIFRFRYEQRIRKSEEKFRTLVEGSRDLIWETDPKGGCRYASPKLPDILGYRVEEVRGKPVIDFLAEEKEMFTGLFRELAQNKIPFHNLEMACRSKQGDTVVLETSAFPIIAPGGELLGYRGVSRDVTLRKAHEKKLNHQRKMLRGILDAIQESAFLMDRDGRVLHANFTVAERLNTDVKHLVGKPLNEFLPQAVMEPRMKRVAEVLATGQPATFEDVRFGRHVENRIYPLIDSETGDVTELAVLGMDITDRKNAEQELKKLWHAIDQSPISVVITDGNGDIEYVNPAFSAVTGYGSAEVLGKNPGILKSEVHGDAFYRDMWQQLKSGKTWQGEICNRKKDGTLFWEEATISPVLLSEGGTSHFIAVKQDISIKKDLERIREDVERIMRHDLKTPLNAIMGIPQVLQMDDGLTSEQLELINMIEDAGQRMLDMIDMSLTLFKMETGSYTFSPALVDVSAAIGKVIEENQSLLSAKRLTVAFENEGAAPPVFALAEEIPFFSMFSNLFVNALEASPRGEQVTVSITRNAGKAGVDIRIHNKGVVPKAIRNDFFEKYKTFGKQKGTGLGTYSARLIARSMGGALEMETSKLLGTTLTITLQNPPDEQPVEE